MYDITRTQAAKLLGVSTRTVDRYVKSGKVRSRKDGKIVYLHNDDVKNIGSNGDTKQEIIVEQKTTNAPKTEKQSQVISGSASTQVEVRSKVNRGVLDKVYNDLREEIKEKNEVIKELSIRLGRAEEIAKNSVNVVDYKKSQFLLEESKEHLHKEIEDVKREKEKLEGKLRHEKQSNIVLIIVVVFLFTVAATIWMMHI